MNQEFFSLTEDQYIIKLGKDTFTISRLQELIAIQFEEHIMNYGDFFNLTFSLFGQFCRTYSRQYSG